MAISVVFWAISASMTLEKKMVRTRDVYAHTSISSYLAVELHPPSLLLLLIIAVDDASEEECIV
jgi:hypothetical protein